MSPEFVPNSFQTPNDYVDQCMAFLTPEEWKVLSYFARRIFGFNKRQDNVSLKQLSDGIRMKSGEMFDYGTGLSAPTIRKALEALCEFNILIQIAPNDPHKNIGPLYELQLDGNQVDMEKMYNRAAKWDQRARAAMEKARAARGIDTPVMPLEGVNAITPPPCNDITVPLCNAVTPPPCNGVSTQYPVLNPIKNPDQKEAGLSEKNPSAQSVLKIFREQMAAQVDQTQYRRYVLPLEVVSWDGARLVVGSENEPAIFWLKNRGIYPARQIIQGICPGGEIDFVVTDSQGKAVAV